MKTLRVRCNFNGGQCPYFTDGKVYTARLTYASHRIAEVTDDKGNGRVIATAGVCAHLIRPLDRGTHVCVGTWTILNHGDMASGRLWTLTSPWDVSTSPLDGDMIPVLTFARREDASAAVFAQNNRLRNLGHKAEFEKYSGPIGILQWTEGAVERDGQAGCIDCGKPLHNAEGGINGRCPECAA